MTDIVNNATIRVVADASGVEAGLRPAINAANRAGQAITQTGERSAAAARSVEHSQRNIIASIQRTTVAMEAGGRSTASYYELLARNRGVDPTSLTPYLNQLRAVEAAQTEATKATQAQAAAARELSQAQGAKESFLAGLREQIALFGKSAEEVQRYRAAQAGAAQESSMLILQLQNMKAAHEQSEAAARAQAAAQREAAQAEASKATFLDGLREQIVLFGKSTEGILEYRAAQAGAANEAAPLIAQLRSLREAHEQAAAAARQTAQAQRDSAQAQSARDNFLAGLREQIALFGKSTEEVLRYRAAQAGAANAADPLIAQLRTLQQTQDQVAASARAAAQAQQDAAQAQSRRDTFLEGLREQIALYGRSTEEVQRHHAAQLGLTAVAEPLIAQLHAMRTAQEQVAAAARAADQAQREALRVQAGKDSFIAGLREQIAVFGLSTEEVLRYRAAQLGLTSSTEPLIAQLRDLRLAQEQQTYATRMEAQAQRELAQAQASRTSFLKGLEQQVAAIGKTRTELLEMQAAQLGVTTQAKPMLDQLRAQDQAFRNGGMSAAAMNAALRGVPAQMTDIIVSLQGGQAPLTVLLQQGGQLRDMFGGVGAAARALGGAVLGLINPYTVTVAVLGTLAYAYKAGHEEAVRYSRALIMTGNFAGTTAGQMADMAASMEEINGSQGTSAKALTTLASTGAIAGANLEKFGTVAVDAQRVLSKSVEDTAKEFAALGKDPLTALRAMGDQYGFVTTETYLAVKAAQEQGRMIDAARIAQSAYADGVANQKEKVLEVLSAWERGWINIKTAAGSAWDAVVDFAGGRQEGPQQQLAALAVQRKALEERIERLKRIGKARDDKYNPKTDRDVLAVEAQVAANERAVKSINDKAAADRKAGEDAGLKVQREAVEREWADKQKILLTRAELRDKALAAAQTRGAELGIPQVDIDKQLLAIRREYNDVYVAGIDASITSLRKRGELQDELSRRELAQIQAKRDAGLITEDESLRQIANVDLAGFDRQKQGLQEQLALTKQKINSDAAQRDLAGQIAKIDEQRISRQQQLENDLAAAQRNRSQASMDLYMQGVKAAAAELTGLEDQVKAQQLANEEIGLSREAVAALQAERMLATAALKEETAAQMEALEPGSVTAALYRQQAEELRKLAALRQQGAVNAGIAEDNKKAQDSLNEFLDPARAQTFGEALREAFGTAGDSITKMTSALDAFGKRQAKIAEERGNADLLLRNGKIDEVKHLEYVDKLNQEGAKNRLAGYGAMTSAAAGFFGEQSKGYKALQAASQVFHAAELAMTLAELVPKGISAVLNQGSGDPYTAFGRMAAMAAIVAGLGVAIGGIGSGGVSLSESRQKKQGTGSVLGSEEKSESIAKSLDIMESLASKELGISAGMLKSLRNIEAGISSFSSLLVRTTDIANPDVGTLNTSNGFGKSVASWGLGGVIVGSVLAKIPALGKAFDKVGTSIFGGKQSVEDSGFTMGRANLGSILAGGVNALQYADIKKDGGWFHSDKRSTKLEGIGAEGNRQISTILTSLYDTVFEAGKLLQINGDEFSARLNSFVVDIGKISLKGKTGEEIQKELSAVFSKIGDDLASFGVAGITQFQQVGEGALEALARVASNYAGLDAVLASIGKSFGTTGIASIAAREELLSMAGGIDELASQASSFAENYLTEAERLAPVQKFVTEQLAALGKSDLRSRESFKQYVLGLDLTSEAQREQYVQLMALQEAFAKVYPAIEDTTLSLADAKDALTEAYNTERDAIDATINKMSSFASSLKSLRDNALLGGLSPLSPSQKYAEAKAQYEAVLAAARGGDEAAQSQYQGAFNAFLTASRAVFASSANYTRDFEYAQAATEEAAKWAEREINVYKAQLDVLKLQVSGIIEVNKSVLSVRDALLQYNTAAGKNTGPLTGYAPVSPGPVIATPTRQSTMDAVVNATKAMGSEVAKLRAEQAQHTAALIAAQNRASNESSSAIVGAVRSTASTEYRVLPE
ncbi:MULTISPECIES: phage tail length tape measure family protein [Massilia]|uniref:Phage tail length tape measure family protein n=1 Tax=Massilia haematophila TaxID=457923 RepID=A0ABV7PDL7_9BURK|nr:phage tail length tape measure family protein [Massilia sp.]